jgi:hypothetical protein
MKRTVLAICLATLSACASGGDSSLQSRFNREVATLSCFEGPTSEASCSGTALAVFLRGEQVRHLDWSIEMSSRFIRREYYFDSASPRLVIETVHAKFDAQGDLLAFAGASGNVTGPHCHFEVRLPHNSTARAPIDPSGFFPRGPLLARVPAKRPVRSARLEKASRRRAG